VRNLQPRYGKRKRPPEAPAAREAHRATLGSALEQYIRGLTRDGRIFDFAKNLATSMSSRARASAPRAGRSS
jgi:hypothetical protein